MRRAVVIPTYWTRKSGDRYSDDLVFDHPTLLDEGGTLQRCLESLNKIKGTFDLILIIVPTNIDIQEELEKKILDMLNRLVLNYQIIPIFLSTIEKIYELIKDEEIKEVLNLCGYSQVRNACILIPSILGFEEFTLLDDDEVILDEDFLNTAVENLEKEFQGRKVLAKAGIYLQSYGSPYFKDKEVWWRFFLNGKKAMNKAFELTETGKRFIDAPFAFGGNMVISRQAVEEGIPFDPYIPRGEDIDFLVNVKSEDYAFILDTELKILHLPPRSHNPDWLKLRQDTSRLLYMKCKINRLENQKVKRMITLNDLNPYPGLFLNWSLTPRIFLTSILLCIDYVLKFKFNESKEALRNIRLLLMNYDGQVLKYFLFKEKFRKTVQKLINCSDLMKILLKKTVKAQTKRN
ncbi:glycosyltransferase family 2 protein [[Eubacterium] cellulosolvens]